MNRKKKSLKILSLHHCLHMNVKSCAMVSWCSSCLLPKDGRPGVITGFHMKVALGVTITITFAIITVVMSL